jgi:2-C-methyl-D-erythritol 4-phosphate cytidylyltransferase
MMPDGSPSPQYWAVIPAAGAGRRMGGDRPKQYLPLCGKPVIAHTLERVAAHPLIAGVVVAISPDDQYWPALARQLPEIHLMVVDGGDERCHSVLNGLNHLSTVADEHDWVLVHDAARPCLRREDLDKLIDVLSQHPAGGLLGLPVADTLKKADDHGDVQATVDRNGLWRAFTPQMFRLKALRTALERAIRNEQHVTDEASAMELAGFRPRLVEGHADNIKITHPQDLVLAECFLRQGGEV